ncbi:MAG: hypothetical protein F7C37_06130 [Desulfurococcales archaeon]|nr:hypothetical protein [Desulfurococcales archaeon]
MKRIYIFFIFIVTLLGYVAGALTASVLEPASSSFAVAVPAESSTSYGYVLGYEAIIQYNNVNTSVASENASLTAGPPIGGVSLAYALGYGLGVEDYSQEAGVVANVSELVIPPVGYVTKTVTKTETVTVTSSGSTGSSTSLQEGSSSASAASGIGGGKLTVPSKSDIRNVVEGSSGGILIIAIIIILFGFLLVFMRR